LAGKETRDGPAIAGHTSVAAAHSSKKIRDGNPLDKAQPP
jgi:hypothetical protein